MDGDRRPRGDDGDHGPYAPGLADRHLRGAHRDARIGRARAPRRETYGDPTKLAFLPWLSVAAGAVERSGMTAGDRVVVLGASGQMGGAAVLLALARGAAQVVAVGRDAGSLDRLQALDGRVGAVRSVGARDADAAAIAAAAGGDADVVIDALGPTPTPDLTMAGFDSVRTDGTMVLLGGVRQALPIPYDQLMRRRITLRGSWMCSRRPRTGSGVRCRRASSTSAPSR